MKQKLHRLTIEDVIEIVSEYQVIHINTPCDYNGICFGDARVIFIDRELESRERIKTVIHELYHARHFIHRESNSERQVRSETDRTMGELYDK